MSTSITDYGFGRPKSRENVLFKKLENYSVVIMLTWDCLNLLRNIIYSYQDVRVAKRHRKWSHEVNAPNVKISTIKMGFKGIIFLCVNFPSL